MVYNSFFITLLICDLRILWFCNSHVFCTFAISSARKNHTSMAMPIVVEKLHA